MKKIVTLAAIAGAFLCVAIIMAVHYFTSPLTITWQLPPNAPPVTVEFYGMAVEPGGKIMGPWHTLCTPVRKGDVYTCNVELPPDADLEFNVRIAYINTYTEEWALHGNTYATAIRVHKGPFPVSYTLVMNPVGYPNGYISPPF